MGNDVGDRFAVHGKDHPLTRTDSVDDLTRPIAQLPYADLHVRQCST